MTTVVTTLCRSNRRCFENEPRVRGCESQQWACPDLADTFVSPNTQRCARIRSLPDRGCQAPNGVCAVGQNRREPPLAVAGLEVGSEERLLTIVSRPLGRSWAAVSDPPGEMRVL